MKIRSDYAPLNLTRRYPNLVVVVLMLGLLNGCKAPDSKQPEETTNTTITSESPTVAAGKNPKVVVTNTVLCDLTKQIAASTIDLVLGGVNNSTILKKGGRGELGGRNRVSEMVT
jgi:hypothetical protein